MRLSYDWTESDWNEAVTLATEKPRRRGSVPGMVYALVGIPLIGAVMDGVRSVRGTGKLTGSGVAVPALLVGLAAVLGVGFFAARLQRRRKVLEKLPMPTGQWEALLQESGWRFQPKTDQADASAVVTADSAGEDAAPSGLPQEMKDALVVETIEAVASPTAAEPAQDVAEKEVIVKSEVLQPVADSSAPGRLSVSAPAETERLIPPEAQPVSETVEALALEAEVETKSPPVRSSSAEAQLNAWKDLTASRAGDHVIVFLHRDGFHAVPIRCMTPDQASHLHRMVVRKLRPAPIPVPQAR